MKVHVQLILKQLFTFPRLIIEQHKRDPNGCLMKLDFPCIQSLQVGLVSIVAKEFPELLGWVHFCYFSTGELRFGSKRLSSFSGTPQGSPPGPFLFSLVLTELLDQTDVPANLNYQVGYLDVGTTIHVHPHMAVAEFYNRMGVAMYKMFAFLSLLRVSTQPHFQIKCFEKG